MATSNGLVSQAVDYDFGPHQEMCLSPDGGYLAVASLDGQLNIWDTLTSLLVTQYTPSSHLSATCSRISWPPVLSRSSRSKGKSLEAEVAKYKFVALGTENGSIMLFSVAKGELHSWAKGHDDRVTDVSWLPQADSLFSCSLDHQVIEWSISGHEIKCKANLDKSPLHAVLAIDSENVLTGANSIKWWNWPKRQLLKTFHGHSTELRFIKPVPRKEANHDEFYFSTSAQSDRYINVWKLTGESNSIATMALDEEPLTLEPAISTSSNSVYYVSVSRSGTLFQFEQDISSSSTTPIEPQLKLNIWSETRTRRQKTPAIKVPFRYGYLMLHDDLDLTNVVVLLCYGNVNRPVFERVTFPECETHHRKMGGVMKKPLDEVLPVTSKPGVINQSSHTKIKSGKRKRVTEIGPVGFLPGQSLYNNIGGLVDDVNNNQLEVTLGDKLKELEDDDETTTGGDDKTMSKNRRKKKKMRTLMSDDLRVAESQVNVLMQGLQSRDEHLLKSVLDKTDDEAMMHNTMRKLPVEYVPHLLRHLQSGMCGKSPDYQKYLKWINYLIQTKISYLTMMPDIAQEFISLNQLLSARTSILERCYQLKGRLDIMLSQVKPIVRTDNLTRTQPKVTYESDSSDSEEGDEEEEDDEEMSVDDNELLNDSSSDADHGEDEIDEEMYETDEEEEEEVDREEEEEENDEDDEDEVLKFRQKKQHRSFNGVKPNIHSDDDDDMENEDDDDDDDE